MAALDNSNGRKLLPVTGVVVLLAVVWYSHVVLSRLGDPMGLLFDRVLWIAGSILKAASAVALLWLLACVHSAVFASKRRALQAFALWTLVSCATLAALAFSRSWWAAHLATAAVTYYHPGDSIAPMPSVVEHRQAWSLAWSDGRVVAAEVALLTLLAAIQAATALYLGKRPIVSVVIACLVCEFVLVAYGWWCPWFLLDYDFFHGDIIAVALVLDQFTIVANDPYTSLCVPLYLALLIASLAFLKWIGAAGVSPWATQRGT